MKKSKSSGNMKIVNKLQHGLLLCLTAFSFLLVTWTLKDNVSSFTGSHQTRQDNLTPKTVTALRRPSTSNSVNNDEHEQSNEVSMRFASEPSTLSGQVIATETTAASTNPVGSVPLTLEDPAPEPTSFEPVSSVSVESEPVVVSEPSSLATELTGLEAQASGTEFESQTLTALGQVATVTTSSEAQAASGPVPSEQSTTKQLPTQSMISESTGQFATEQQASMPQAMEPQVVQQQTTLDSIARDKPTALEAQALDSVASDPSTLEQLPTNATALEQAAEDSSTLGTTNHVSASEQPAAPSDSVARDVSSPSALGQIAAEQSVLGASLSIAEPEAAEPSVSVPTATSSQITPTHAEIDQNNDSLENIPLLTTSSLYEDLISVQHDAARASITIRLSKNGRCPRPYVRGRLAGPALLMLQDWQYFTTTSKGDDDDEKEEISVMVGTYPPPPFAGKYFVDLMTVFCDNFLLPPLNETTSMTATTRTMLENNDNDADELKLLSKHEQGQFLIHNRDSFANTCSEPYDQRQLTDPNTLITVTQTITTAKDRLAEVAPGYWIHKDYNNTFPTQNIYQQRIQPPFCNKTSDDIPGCTIPNLLTIETLITSYQWHWTKTTETGQVLHPVVVSASNNSKNRNIYQEVGNKTVELVKEILPHSPKRNMTVCLVGASHSRKAFEMLKATRLFGTYYQNLTIEWVDLKMPKQVTPRVVGEGCGIKDDSKSEVRIVVAVGQWANGAHMKFKINKDSPFAFHKLAGHYQRMLQGLHTAFPTTPIYARSINYNPMGNYKYMCPPLDWRSPTVIDGYNEIIQQVVKKVAKSSTLQFLDTNFLVGPVWDTASDWCHFDRPVGTLHAAYLMKQALHDVL